MGPDLDLVVSAGRAVLGSVERACEIGVRGGRIVEIAPHGTGLVGARTLRLSPDEVLLPGLVDTHVHVNEPGRTAWEGFTSATRAAAAGGVTTIVDMPLNCLPPTVDADALKTKRLAARGQCRVDVGFWGGAVPGNSDRLADLHAAGVFGFKCFLADSGVPEFPPLGVPEMTRDLAAIGALGSLLLVHAEDASTLAGTAHTPGRRYADFLASRPPAAETRAVAAVLEAARRTGARAHILHLSSADALDMIAEARADGVTVTAETCPHYLTFCAEEIPGGATLFKCCPPIRGAANRERLWAGLADGVIDAVVSDHSPCTPDLKHLDSGDFSTAWGGIASLQIGLPAVWTAARQRGRTLSQVAGWMATAPARIAGLHAKGVIALGRDADLVVFAPDAESRVDPARLQHRNPLTPYAGLTLRGMVRRTLLRGADATRGAPAGRMLRAHD